MDVEKVLTDILAKRVDTTGVTEDSVLTDLGLDSLDLVEIVLEIEEALGVEFDNDEILTLRTVGDVKALAVNKVSK